MSPHFDRRSATPGPVRAARPTDQTFPGRAASWGTQKTGTTGKSSGDSTLKTVLNMLSCLEKSKNPNAVGSGSAGNDNNNNKELQDVFTIESLKAVTTKQIGKCTMAGGQ